MTDAKFIDDCIKNKVGRPETSLLSKLQAAYIPVPESGCWLWEGRTDKDGYGITSYKCKAMKTHRASWIVFRGEIPKGFCVCHKCDNPSCINPDHLFVGTNLDNVKDRDKKNRAATMEKSGCTKFKKEDVIKIRNMHKDGISYNAIGKMFSTSATTIRRIVLRQTWSLLA